MTPAGGLAPAVIVPLDGSVRATAALPVAKELAALEGATLHVVHVGARAVSPGEVSEALKLTPQQLSGSVLHQLTGSPAAGIVRQAAVQRAVLIVLCAHTKLDRPRGVLGSVARDVLQAAPCPVVLVQPERGPRPWKLRRLLLPHDGTPTTAAAVRSAAALAARAGAELEVLHIATPGKARPVEPGTCTLPRYLDQPQHEWPTWAREFLERACALRHLPESVAVRLFFAVGEAGPAIVEFAIRHATDLIALAWRGAFEPGRAPTVRAVLRDAPCPVIVFRVERARA